MLATVPTGRRLRFFSLSLCRVDRARAALFLIPYRGYELPGGQLASDPEQAVSSRRLVISVYYCVEKGGNREQSSLQRLVG